MTAYLARRVLSMIPVPLIASIISFCLLYVLPGDPAVAILGESVGNRATVEAIRHDLGLDQPLYVQYGNVPGLLDLLNQADSPFDDTQRQDLFVKARKLMYESAWFGYTWFEISE